MRTDLSRRGAWLLFALVHLAMPLWAGGQQAIDVADVRCSALYTGPPTLTHGYFPVQVSLWNRGEGAARVSLEAEQQWGEEDLVTRKVRLEPDERLEFELLLRARMGASNEYMLTFDVGGDEGAFAVGASDWSGGHELVVMYYGATVPEAGAAERWTMEWTKKAAMGEFIVGAGVHDDLSTSWSAYTPYDGVVLSVDGGLPDRAKLDALLAWCRTGGMLVFAGEDLEPLLEARRDLARHVRADLEVEGAALPVGARALHFGQGRLVLLEGNPPGSEVMEVPEEWTSPALALFDGLDYLRWVPGGFQPSTDRMTRVSNELSEFGDLPLRGLMVLLVLFALLMGPVNFLWVRRMRRPLLLLVTVPGIALMTSLGLLIFGVLSQGLDIKVTSRSYSFLDQADHQATTAEVRRIFAGSSPGEGLRPGLGTALFPEPRFWFRNFRSGYRFEQNLDEGRLLAGDYLPIRRPVVQLLLTDRPSRLRLEVEQDGEGARVSNALGGRVESLYLRDAQGRYHHLMGALAQGESALLVPGLELTDEDEQERALEAFWGPGVGTGLPAGCYLAEVDAPDLRDPCGVPVHEASGRHFVLGLFAAPLEGER